MKTFITNINIKNILYDTFKYNSEDIEDTKQSIQEQGLLKPIVVRSIVVKNNPDNKGKVEIIHGHKRLQAFISLEHKEIPAINLSNNPALEDALNSFLKENSRKKTNQMKDAITALTLSLQNYKQDRIAQIIQTSRSNVSNMMRLFSMPTQIMQALLENKITIGQAHALLQNKKALNIFQTVLENNWTVLQIREYDGAKKKGERKVKNGMQNESANEANNDMEYAEKIITRLTNMDCNIFSSSQQIAIKYNSLEDVEKLIVMLSESKYNKKK